MRRSGAVSTRVGGTAAESGGVCFQRCIREWRRLFPIKTAENIAALYGAPIRTAENWLSGASSPSGYWLGIIFNRSGPEFLVAVMPAPDPWIAEAARAAKRARLDAELARIEAEIAAEARL